MVVSVWMHLKCPCLNCTISDKGEPVEVQEGIDVAQHLDEAEEAVEHEEDISSSSINFSSIRPLMELQTAGGLFSRGLLNEDDALKLILQASSSSSSSSSGRTDKKDTATTPPVPKKEEVKCIFSLTEPLPGSEEAKAAAAAASKVPEPSCDAEDGKKEADLNNSFKPEDSIYALNDSTSSNEQDNENKYKVNVAEGYLEKLIEEIQTEARLKREEQRRIRMSSYESSLQENASLDQDDDRPVPSLLAEASELIHAKKDMLPYLSGFIHSWNPFGSGRYFDTPPPKETTSSIFKSIKNPNLLNPDMSIASLTVDESQKMFSLYDKCVREDGLDGQNYQCDDCTKAIGTIFGPAKLCAYTKKYYCDECHLDDVSVIPSRVVYNWDFRLFRISRKAKLFLTALNVEPVIDAVNFTSQMFTFAPDLDRVFILRKKISYVSAYLATCNKSDAHQRFLSLLGSRDYLCNDVYKYSIRDLEDVKSGKMQALLDRVLRFGEHHVFSCVLCSGKGFICEVCQNDCPIYPFHLEHIGQCSKCFNVYHLNCSIQVKDCPRCERREARNLNWHVSNSKMNRQDSTSST